MGLVEQLSASLILQSVECGAENLFVEVFDEIPSTNRYLASAAKQANFQRSHLVVADSQSAGVGRRGKSWVSESGNISMSLLSYFDVPPNKLMGLSLVTGVSVAATLRDAGMNNCQLKWPNDILVDGAKLAGLLIEIPQSSTTTCSVVTGIGINYQALSASAGVEKKTASLASANLMLSRSELIGKITSALMSNYQSYCRHGLTVFANQWDDLDYLKGKLVNVFLYDKQVEGRVMGIAENGELLVDIGGFVQSFNSGEVSVRRL